MEFANARESNPTRITVKRLILGGLAGAVAGILGFYAIPNGLGPGYFGFVFLGGVVAGAVIGLLMPRRWDSVRVRPGVLTLTCGRRTLDIPVEDIRLITARMGLFSLSGNPEKCRMLHIMTAERGHTLVLLPSDLPEAFKALLEACPGAFGLSLDFCIRLPLQDFTMDRADAVVRELRLDATRHFLKAAALSLLTVFIAFMMAQGVSTLELILLVATAFGALIWWDHARRALKAAKAYMSAVKERVAQGDRLGGEITFVERSPEPPSQLVRVFIKSALVLFWIPVIGLGLSVAGVVGSRKNRGSGWRAAAIASLVASLIIPAGVVFAVWILPRLR